jgi:hypothetical protein
MKRTTIVTAFLAMGLLLASSFAAAQDAPATASGGQVTLGLLSAPNVASSKFQEYREVPKGVSIPFLSLFSTSSALDFKLQARNVRQTDQRYTGWANFSWLGVSFDYNQIPHNMGNDGHTFLSETSPGVWSMSATLRKALGDAVDAVGSSARTYTFYQALVAPTVASAGSVDLSGLRKRGEVEFDLGQKLPFDLAFTYMREVKTGTRGASGGNILGVVSSNVDVPEPLNEVVQDFGIRWGYKFKADKLAGNVYATFNRNVYNNRQDSLIIDNPFRASDLAYVSTSVPGGPGQVRFGTAPDNEASRGAFGVLLKFKRQTRITGDLAFGSWTQNQQFLPYTINSAILTPAGTPATSLASLQQPSLDGKISTTTVNFSFSSRPIEGLGIRARYRSYGYKDKSARYLITGDTSGSPDRSWGAAGAATEEEPYGHATANRTDADTGRFDVQVSYDIKDLTLEAAYRNLRSSWVGRKASSGTDGKENGYKLSAVYHANDWLGFRGTFDQAKRTVSGIEAGSTAALQGVMADHAERKSTRTGLDIELTPSSMFGVTFAYFRRNDDYPNRPFEVPGNADTESGLLKASYDTFTLEFDFTPSERAEIGFYYTYEKNASTNQWVTLTSGALNNLLNEVDSYKGNTFGANAVIHVVPEKWTFSLMANHQKVDGLMDITAREAGAFYSPGRAALVPAGTGGAQDITDFDDTKLTTFVADLAYSVAKAWTLSIGYWYEKYSFTDAFTSGTTIFPQSVLFFLKANDGGYKASVGYAKLNYRF